MPEKELVKALINIGFEKKEAAVYFSLISLGEGTIPKIAQRSKINRATTGIILEKLWEKGYIKLTPNAYGKKYHAEDTSLFLEKTNTIIQNISHSQKIINEFSLKSRKEKEKVLHFSGGSFTKGLIYGIDKLKQNGSFRAFFSSGVVLDESSTKTIEKFRKSIFQKNINYEAIAPNDISLKKYREEEKYFGKHNVLEIEKDLLPKEMSLEIFDDFVKISLFEEKEVIILEGENYSKNFNTIFKLCFEALNKNKTRTSIL